MSTNIRPQTVTLIGKLLHPLTESNLIPFSEYREIITQLKSLATKGQPLPKIAPKLVDMKEAADMLGISLASFKNLEAEFPFKRKLVGHSVRFRNTDIIRYIVANDEATQVE
ncbi:hypothetical protein [Victivallis vadensis]|uniref:helix-turn-helix transcriptional regulator n=1 Tax=Victivallis vadensis TaxID=172901 RepID=UPI00307D7824